MNEQQQKRPHKIIGNHCHLGPFRILRHSYCESYCITLICNLWDKIIENISILLLIVKMLMSIVISIIGIMMSHISH